MINVNKLLIDFFIKDLKESYEHTYSYMDPAYGEIISWVGQLALENIANTDCMYHDISHTIMVVSAGKEIIKGKHILEGGVTPKDWLHYTVALLCHDIGFVKGICSNDRDGYFATGNGNEIKKYPEARTDASLTPYHVDRSKLFVKERFGGNLLPDIDADLVGQLIEMTRFPVPKDQLINYTNDYGALVRAADFIGQLGDPNYLRKIPALFFEFEEAGMNDEIGYTSPGDMRGRYAKFYWQVVNPFINDALRYLHVTQEGKQWVANLQSNVFDVEHHMYRMESIPQVKD